MTRVSQYKYQLKVGPKRKEPKGKALAQSPVSGIYHYHGNHHINYHSATLTSGPPFKL